MFLLATTALAGVLIGWPCQRLNWGWRNVWATCSIHSWAPAPATTVETPAQIPTGFRQYSSPSPTSPTNMMTAGGWYQPAAPNTAVPQYFCTSAAATGSGVTANLRNRCRRAVDAYGALVKQCTASPSVVAPVLRGPNTLSPDNMPAAGHAPHLSNVAGLSVNAQFCVLPAGTPYHPNNLNSPSNTCPGLLGWFTVVYNACGFTNAPSLNPTNGPNTPNVNGYFPLGNAAGVAPLLVPGPVQPSTRVGYFCTSSAVAAPDSWNQAGSTFRTSRCRKALDQFGRTAQRCHQSAAPQAAGPAQAGGYSDPLRLLALGSSAATATPNGLNIIAPACN